MRKLKRQVDSEDLRVAVLLYEDGVSLTGLKTIFQTSREWMRQRILLFTPLRAQGRQNIRRERTASYFKGRDALRFAYAYASRVGYQEVPLPTSRLSKLLSLHSLLIRDLLREQEIPLRRGTPRRSKDASQLVHQAVKRGDIIPTPCEVPGCGKGPYDKTGKRLMIIAHHDDYNFPLVIRWLCRKHHAEWHKINTAIMEGEQPS